MRRLNGIEPGISGYIFGEGLNFFLIQVFSLILSFILNYVLIKVVTRSAYGAYIYIFNLLSLVAGFCVAGTDNLLVKMNNAYKETGEKQLLKGIIYFSFSATIIFSLVAAVACTLIFIFTGFTYSLTNTEYVLLFFLALPLIALTLLIQSSFRGFRKIILSQVAEKMLRPFLIIAGIGLLFFLNIKPDFSLLIKIAFVAITLSFLLIFILHNRYVLTVTGPVKAGFESRNWFKTATGFLLLDALFLLNSKADILILGALSNSNSVGNYNIVLRLSELVGLGLFMINFIIAPVIAKMIYKKEKLKLQRLVTDASRLTLLIGILTSVVLIIFRTPVLHFFDIYSVEAEKALVILCCGQLINVLAGSVGLLLTMSGNQIYSVLSLGISITVTIILDIILIPMYDIVGVAIASSAGLGLWNIIMYFFVRNRLGLRTTAFSGF